MIPVVVSLVSLGIAVLVLAVRVRRIERYRLNERLVDLEDAVSVLDRIERLLINASK